MLTSVPLNLWIPLKNVPAPAGISIEEDFSIPLYSINHCPWQEVSSRSLQSLPSLMFLVWPCEVLSRLNVTRMFPLPLTILNLTAWNSSAQELSCQSVYSQLLWNIYFNRVWNISSDITLACETLNSVPLSLTVATDFLWMTKCSWVTITVANLECSWQVGDRAERC